MTILFVIFPLNNKQKKKMQIFLSTRKTTKFEKVLTMGKICSDVDSEVYFHHFENRFLNVSVRVQSKYYSRSLFFFTKLLVLLLVLVVLSTKELHTRVKNKIYLLLQFIKKIVKFKFFFIAEFDISTSTKKLEILKSPKKLASFTLFQLNRMRNYYLQFFHRFYLEWLIQNYDCII